jgi:hypothetical protein
MHLVTSYMRRKEHKIWETKHTCHSNNTFKGIVNKKETCSRCNGESTYIVCRWKLHGILASQWLRHIPTSRNYLPFQNTRVTITTNATRGAGNIHPSGIPESQSRRMSPVELELLTQHNTWVTITTNATSGSGTTYPSRIPESPSRRMSLVEQELLTLPKYLSHHHVECH